MFHFFVNLADSYYGNPLRLITENNGHDEDWLRPCLKALELLAE